MKLARSSKGRMEILDVGGRLSNYTIGIPANITVTDLPRRTAVQKSLHLGTTDRMMERLLQRRSNVTSVQYDDMTKSDLLSNAYDCVVAVEVLEHVEDDSAFVCEVQRVLKPGRTFLMTTPNGEWVKNVNPDHKRHYTREQLAEVIGKSFEAVNVEYAVKNSYFYKLGLRSWTLKHPIRTAVTMISAGISAVQSKAAAVKSYNTGTHHLIARATK